MKKNPVVHFEMPYENHERLSTFYSGVFGWQMHKMGAEMGDYVLAGTTETDENRMVKTPGNINGGFFPKTPDGPATPSVVIEVENVKEAAQKITAAGGQVHGEPQEIPGIGLWATFTDTEGNHVSVLQPFNR